MEGTIAMPWLTPPFGLSTWALAWVLLAALTEAAAYVSLASERARAGWTPLWLTLLAPLPYLLYTLPLGLARLLDVAVILAASGLISHWFQRLPRRPWLDWLFIALAAAPVLFKVFALLYPSAAPGLRMDFLGQLLWIRVTIATILNGWRPEGIGFGFWPTRREWGIGALAYAGMLPVLFGLAELTGFARFAWPPWGWAETLARVVGTFFGILWVVALSEELLFRGLLQRAIGIVGAAVCFGLVHLGFRQFPNWRFALVAGVAGLFYGLAYRRAGSIRAAMVAHALTVVTWKTLFR